MNPKMQRRESNADFCRRMGYVAGTRLAGDEGYGVTVIEITAVGEQSILAKTLSHAGIPRKDGDFFEGMWTLDCRDWELA